MSGKSGAPVFFFFFFFFFPFLNSTDVFFSLPFFFILEECVQI